MDTEREFMTIVKSRYLREQNEHRKGVHDHCEISGSRMDIEREFMTTVKSR